MRPVMRRALIARALALAAPLALASCSTTRPAAVQPQPPAAPPACLAVKAYTPDQLEEMAAAVRALPPDSPRAGWWSTTRGCATRRGRRAGAVRRWADDWRRASGQALGVAYRSRQYECPS